MFCSTINGLLNFSAAVITVSDSCARGQRWTLPVRRSPSCWKNQAFACGQANRAGRFDADFRMRWCTWRWKCASL